MDHPYHIYRDDGASKVDRACTRYLGDAMLIVKAIIKEEVNHCMWWIRNEETNRLCAKWEYKSGHVTQLV